MRGTEKRKTRTGVVKSDRMDKTIVVVCERRFPHPRYGKMVRAKTTLRAHDPERRAHTGDTVEVMECRPLSKTKCWRLVRVLTAEGEGGQP